MQLIGSLLFYVTTFTVACLRIAWRGINHASQLSPPLDAICAPDPSHGLPIALVPGGLRTMIWYLSGWGSIHRLDQLETLIVANNTFAFGLRSRKEPSAFQMLMLSYFSKRVMIIERIDAWLSFTSLYCYQTGNVQDMQEWHSSQLEVLL